MESKDLQEPACSKPNVLCALRARSGLQDPMDLRDQLDHLVNLEHRLSVGQVDNPGPLVLWEILDFQVG